jgi:Domain of Unknown Function (DUF1206)
MTEPTRQMHSARRTASSAGRDAATSSTLQWLARGGLTARGVNYLLIGSLALQIAFGSKGKPADTTGALHTVAKHPGGIIVLWLLAVGFAGLVIWRLAETAYGQPGPDGHKAGKRLGSLARAVLYAFICGTVVSFILGAGSKTSGNKQSKDMTAQLMGHSGGRWLVALIGIGILAAGVGLVIYGIRRKFTKQLKTSQMSHGTAKVVTTLGVVGNVARGVVFCVAGGFLVDAAVRFNSQTAQGIDGSLHKLATTPLGPWLLVAVALGLMIFGVYSFCEARWRQVQPG